MFTAEARRLESLRLKYRLEVKYNNVTWFFYLNRSGRRNIYKICKFLFNIEFLKNCARERKNI